MCFGSPGSAGSRKAGERSYTAPDQPDPRRPAGLAIVISGVWVYHRVPVQY